MRKRPRPLYQFTSPMSQQHVTWGWTLFNNLNEGGMWAVPRSGLVFRRRGPELVLEEAMPWQEEMPGTPEEFKAYQTDDYEQIKRHFEGAGISVRDGRPEQ